MNVSLIYISLQFSKLCTFYLGPNFLYFSFTFWVHMTLNNNCGLRFICASDHVAKFCLPPVSVGNKWSVAWILYGCKPDINIPCWIRWIDYSGIPALLSASRTLLFPFDVCTAKTFMTFCTTITRYPVKVGLPPPGQFSELPAFSKRRTKWSIPFNEIGLFCTFSPFFVWNFRNVTVLDHHSCKTN